MDKQSINSEEYHREDNEKWEEADSVTLSDPNAYVYETILETTKDDKRTRTVDKSIIEKNEINKGPTAPKISDVSFFLTEQEIKNCKEAFEKYKDPKTKMLSSDQLGPAMRQIGLTPSKKQIEQYREIVDNTAIGVLILDSFIEVACYYKINKEKNITLEGVDAAFQVLAQYNSNFSTYQFLEMISTIGEPFDIDELISIRNYMDPKRSGHFDYKALISRIAKMDEVKIPKKKKEKKGRKVRK